MDMAKTMNIITVTVKPNQLKEAEEKYSAFLEAHPSGQYNNKSYRGGSLMLDSLVSEIVIADYFKLKKSVNTKDYDFVTSKNIKIDLKTKPKSDSPPKPEWYASVPLYQLNNQKCDYYFFNRINRDKTLIWIVGYISKVRFERESTLFRKGEVDPTSSPKSPWEFPEDTRCIKICDLNEF